MPVFRLKNLRSNELALVKKSIYTGEALFIEGEFMNRTHVASAANIIPRLCLVLAMVYLLCHIDVLFGSKPISDDPWDEELTGLTTFVENPRGRSAQGASKSQPAVRDTRLEALASFIQIRYKTSTAVAYSAAVAAKQASRETGVSDTLLLAVAGIESRFRPHADNGKDKGIMQVNPDWHPEKVARIGGAGNLFKVGPGIKTGARILKEYSDLENGDMVRTLLRYNGARSLNRYPGKVLTEKRLLDEVLAKRSWV